MTTTHHMLAKTEVEAFRRDGFILHKRPVFEPDEFAALQAHFETKLRAWEEAGNRPEGMDVPHFTDPALFRWIFSDRVLDLVEPLLGPDIALWSTHFICKPAGTGKRVPWHEDSAYWQKVLDPMEVVTVWFAIDPSRPENGCMRVIPGTHHNGYSEYEQVEDRDAEVFGSRIKPELIDESKAVDCVLEPNECSIHHAKLIHGSNPNTSPLRRCGYTMRFVPAHAKFNPTSAYHQSHKLYVARGRGRDDIEYGDPSRANEDYVRASDEEKRRMKALQ